jgi:hypothetical protein
MICFATACLLYSNDQHAGDPNAADIGRRDDVDVRRPANEFSPAERCVRNDRGA